MRSPHLRVTERCLRDDLGLSPDLAGRDARDYCSEHEILRAFVIKREGAPDEGERTRGIEPYGKCVNLHHGRWRAVTAWDVDEDVCWLLAFSDTHATGEERDAYNYFVSLGERQELFPRASDYKNLWDRTILNIVDELAGIGETLFSDARSNPGTEVNETVSSSILSIIIDIVLIETDTFEEGWISFQFPPETETDTETALILFGKIVPNSVIPLLEPTGDFRGRAPRHDEVIFRWDRAL